MKYQSVNAFEGYLKTLSIETVPAVFLVVTSCSYQRRKIADKIRGSVRSFQEEGQYLYADALQGSFSVHQDELNTLALLPGKKVLYLDGIEQYKKGEMEKVASYLESPSRSALLILGAASSKGLAPLYDVSQTQWVSCDLSAEKPWEVGPRLKREIIHQAEQAGKRLSGDAADLLLERIGLSLPALEGELEKLLLYCHERSQVTQKEVELLCAPRRELTPWELADQLLWSSSPSPSLQGLQEVDLSVVLPLIGQIRIQLQQGMKISVLLARGVRPDQLTSHLPDMKPVVLKKWLSGQRTHSLSFFHKALNLLFEMELMAKNSSLDPAWILERFLFQLKHVPR